MSGSGHFSYIDDVRCSVAIGEKSGRFARSAARAADKVADRAVVRAAE
jgi:hypothetical protein